MRVIYFTVNYMLPRPFVLKQGQAGKRQVEGVKTMVSSAHSILQIPKPKNSEHFTV